jgi:hypothetical protein
MPYTPDNGDRAAEAARALTHDATTLLDKGLELMLAFALGGLLARLLRRRGMHWSWTASAIAPALLLSHALGGVALPTLAALTTATLRGRRSHRDDLLAGGDLAGIARERRTPLAALRTTVLGEGAAARWWNRLATSTAIPRSPASGELSLGRGRDGRAVTIPFAPGSGGHLLVVGATGSGKTVTQTLIAVQAIAQGRAAVVVDPKGDGQMRAQLRAAAAAAGRAFIEWTPSGPSAYNPYARGGETEIADRLLAGERFTEPHYLRQAQRYLGHAVRALRACSVEVSLRTTVEMLEPAALEQLLRRAPEQQADAGQAYLDSLTPRQLRDLAGVRDRLAILAESDAGHWLEPHDEQRPSFDLLGAVRDRAVVYFGLETDSRPLLAQMLGAAVVQDLQSTVAALQASPVPTLVVIDEFSAVSAEHVVALFGRARSAGFTLLLGTQELADLRLPGRERTLEQVMGNLSVLIAHRQVVPASVELLSRLGGSRGCWRVSFSSGGRRTRTRAQEPRLAQDLLMDLPPGSAAVIGFGSPQRSGVVQIERAAGEDR